MTHRRHARLDYAAIEAALAPGTFIGDWDCADFVDQLESVRARIAPLVGPADDARRAVRLLEAFIVGCYEKSEEINESSGGFGVFVRSLFCDWIRARQAAGAGADETVRMLLSWIENDDYGYGHCLAEKATEVLDPAGLDALERAARSRLAGESAGGKETSLHRRRTEILKAIHKARRDVASYSDLCAEEGRLAPTDCEILARMCLAKRRPESALAWAERGLDLAQRGAWRGGSAWQLGRLRREILKTLGRGGEALDSAWEEYQRTPSIVSYRDLMQFVARGERAAWRARAVAASEVADLRCRIELLLETRETARLGELIEATPRTQLVGLSHRATEPAARRLAKSHPELSAKLHAAMALRILEAKKSRYYGEALAHLEKARKLLLGARHAARWEALVREILDAHRRKTGFLPGFERLVGGRSTREPSLRARAIRRWNAPRLPSGLR